MPFRRLAKKSRFEPERKEYQFNEGGHNPVPKPEAAKKKATKLRRPRVS